MTTIGLYIPTWNRMGKAPLLISKDINPSVTPYNATLIVRPSEEAYYRGEGWNCHVLPETAIGLGAARHDCLLHAKEDYVWFCDDDVGDNGIMAIIQYITYYADKERAALMGFGQHFMINQRREKDGVFSRRGSTDRIWGIHRESYLKSGLDMTPWIIMQDLYCWIGMQVLGYQVLISNIYEPAGAGNNMEGGCKDDQYPARILEHATRLAALYPEYVSVIDDPSGSISNIKFGKAFRRRWQKIHDDIPRIITY